jgi:putative pyruvate formate lyase activating enzyme
MNIPSYLKLFETGELKQRILRSFESLRSCTLCPSQCRVNRLAEEKGFCRTGTKAIVSSYGPHFGEEGPISGFAGSGTIFFAYCNLRCDYCQNFECSQLGEGKEADEELIACSMIDLQKRGCHNINLVSPSHVVPQILEAVWIACEKGLRIPLVYNTGGYDSIETLLLLEGIIDIYMPDMKYARNDTGLKYSKVREYAFVNRAAVKEMRRQTGDLIIDENGVAEKGVLIRHLVLPNAIAETEDIIRFISSELGNNVYVNIMFQYRPWYNAHNYQELGRSVTIHEKRDVYSLIKKYGLKRVDEKSFEVTK